MRVTMAVDVTPDDVSQRLITQFDVIRKFRSVVITYICFIVLVRCPWLLAHDAASER